MAASEIARKHGHDRAPSCPSRSRIAPAPARTSISRSATTKHEEPVPRRQRTSAAWACRSSAISSSAGLLDACARRSRRLCAPTVNSYKRLVVGRVAFGRDMGAGVHRLRRQQSHGDACAFPYGRLELRLPDGSCNPYLATAAIIAAGPRRHRPQARPGRAEQHESLRADRRKQVGGAAAYGAAAAEPDRGDRRAGQRTR